MDSLANYGSDGENSNNSDDTKMPCSGNTKSLERRASDANYDPVQMDMSEESNNNNSSSDSGSERAASPAHDRHATGSRRDSSRHRSSPADQRRSDYDSHSSNSRDDRKRTERHERSRNSRESSKSRRSSHDDRRHRENEPSRDTRDSKRSSRDDEKKSSRDDDRRRDRKSSSSCRDDRNEERDKDNHQHHRDERRDRDRERSERDYRRDRDRRHSRDDRTKERHRDERSSRENKEKARTRSRSRSKERAPPLPFRTMSYREEKGRNKLAQLEKLGIELKAPGDPIIPVTIGEPNYYNPLATSTAGKYAEQIQKRKLLWANKSKQEEGKSSVASASTASTWIGTTFTHDQDGKVTAKFKRLMGIKADMPVAPQPVHKPDILKKQEEMFSNMEQQYEVARATTHTQRGVGLGYATGGYQFPR